MTTSSFACGALLAGTAAILGCGSDSSSPSTPATTVAASSGTEAFALVESFDDIAPKYWLPVEVDGDPVAFERGAHWVLRGGSDGVRLAGFDGCGRFSSGTGSDLATLEDGTLHNVALAVEAIDCGDAPVALPLDGDRFLADASGRRLTVENAGAVRVQLELHDSEPRGNRPTPEEECAEQEAIDEAEAEEAEAVESDLQSTIADVTMRLGLARERWADAGVDDYELRFDVGCLSCESFPIDPADPSRRDRRHVIVVEGGVGLGPWADSTIGATVDDWLDVIEDHLRQGGFATAEFDPDLGFPVDVYIATRGRVSTDGGVSDDEYVLQNVEVVPID